MDISDRTGKGTGTSPKALDFCDTDSRKVVKEAFSGFRSEWPKLEAAAPAPSPERLIDLRLQMQAAKLAFIANKRRGALERLGLILKAEVGRLSLQDYLERRFGGQLRNGGGIGCSFDLANVGNVNEGVLGKGHGGGGGGVGGKGGASSVQKLCRMMFLYNEGMGWVFLHQVTGEVVEVVKGFVR